MKIYFIATVIAGVFAATSYAQIPQNSLRKIIKDYIISDIDSSDHPKMDDAPIRMTFTVYDFKGKEYIDNYDIAMPMSDTLSYYVIEQTKIPQYAHLMFARRGDYVIINMDKSLPDIMAQYVELCKLLKFKYKDELFVLKEIIRYFEYNYEENLGCGSGSR